VFIACKQIEVMTKTYEKMLIDSFCRSFFLFQVAISVVYALINLRNYNKKSVSWVFSKAWVLEWHAGNLLGMHRKLVV